MSAFLVRPIWLVGLAAATACNTPQPGVNDTIRFTPRACGNALLRCSFDQPVATGGILEVQISGIGDVSSAGLDVASTNPGILSVTKVADVAGVPTWELRGGIAGAVT